MSHHQPTAGGGSQPQHALASTPRWMELRDIQVINRKKLQLTPSNIFDLALGFLGRQRIFDTPKTHGGGGGSSRSDQNTPDSTFLCVTPQSYQAEGELVGPLMPPPLAMPAALATHGSFTATPRAASHPSSRSSLASFPCEPAGFVPDDKDDEDGTSGSAASSLVVGGVFAGAPAVNSKSWLALMRQVKLLAKTSTKHCVWTLLYTTILVVAALVRFWWFLLVTLPLSIPSMMIHLVWEFAVSVCFSKPHPQQLKPLFNTEPSPSNTEIGAEGGSPVTSSKQLYKGSTTGPNGDSRKNFLNFIVNTKGEEGANPNKKEAGGHPMSAFPLPPNTAVGSDGKELIPGLSHHSKEPGLGGDVATILSSFRPYIPNTYFRQYIRAVDGGTHCVDWLFCTQGASSGRSQSSSLSPQAKGIIGIVPGLTSSSNTFYVETMCTVLANKGYHVAVMNARGMGTTPLTSPRLTCGISSDDVRTMVRTALGDRVRLERELGIPEETSKNILLLGWSLGGAMLTKFLGEEGRDSTPLQRKITASVACCAPWDFHESNTFMETRWLNRSFYRYMLASGCRDYLHRHIDIISQCPELDLELLLQHTHTMAEVDANCVSPHFGFESRFDYYNAASAIPQYLKHIKQPIMCLTCTDDPITGPPPTDDRWTALVKSNSNVSYVASPVGGHLAFLDSWWIEVVNPWLGFLGLEAYVTTAHRGNFSERFIATYFDQAVGASGSCQRNAK